LQAYDRHTITSPTEVVMRILPLCAIVAATVLAIGCTRQEPPAAPLAPPAPTSGWTTDDSTAVAQSLIDASLADPWSGRFKDRAGRVPVVAMGALEDRTGDHVDVASFAQALSARLATSPAVALAGTEQAADVTLSGTISLVKVQGEARFQVDLRLRNASGDAEWQSGLERPRQTP